MDVLSDILGSGHTRSEKELADAVSVLVQITAPCVQDHHVVDGLGKHLETFISSLTRTYIYYIINISLSSLTLRDVTTFRAGAPYPPRLERLKLFCAQFV